MDEFLQINSPKGKSRGNNSGILDLLAKLRAKLLVLISMARNPRADEVFLRNLTGFYGRMTKI